jgi:hypothetical protein
LKTGDGRQETGDGRQETGDGRQKTGDGRKGLGPSERTESGTKMTKIKDLTIDDLEYLIEQKVLEILGDPDAGLELSEESKEELRKRLKSSSRRISHEEVLKRFG